MQDGHVVGLKGYCAMSRRRPLLLALLTSASLAVPSYGVQHALAQQVGTAAAVNPAAQARGPGGSRTIIIGNSIAHRERIQTTSAGSVQLVFLDKTSMTVGPNSDLSIDEYVYDPTTNSGKLAATLTKGVMRFVGGQISHAGNAHIATPTAVVGIRGGVGIFHPNSVFIGFGQGRVTSGSSTVTLDAGEFTQTPGGGAAPTPPGPPPAGFLQSVIAKLQSRAGQGGGARATAAQVNRARRAATGSARGNIATNVEDALRAIPFTIETLAWLNLTIQTVVATRFGEPQSPDGSPGGLGDFIPNPPLPVPGVNQPGGPQPSQTLSGFTGGLIHSIGSNGSIGQSFGAVGATLVQIDPSQNRTQANFAIASTSQESQNALQFGSIQFGSINPALASGNITITQFDGLIGTADALLPAVNANNAPVSSVNNQILTQHTGVFVEIKPGSQLSNALSSSTGRSFCQCEYTRWGLWNSQFIRPGPNNSTIDERAQMFWVAGRFPNAGDVPTQGTAAYDGHTIAAIRNGSQTYVAAGGFQNVINFGTRTGNVSVNNLDATNYAGRVVLGSDPRFFSGTLSGVNNQNRNMIITGSFFNGRTSPVGEMGGALQVGGPSYLGTGIFAGRMR
jgi:hypothetical protein